MIASLLRHLLRRVYRIPAADEQALHAAFAAYTATVGHPSPACRDLTIARHQALHGSGDRP